MEVVVQMSLSEPHTNAEALDFEYVCTYIYKVRTFFRCYSR